MVAKANCLSNHQIYVACNVRQVQNVTFLFLPLRFVRKEKLTNTCCIDFTTHVYYKENCGCKSHSVHKNNACSQSFSCAHISVLVLVYNPFVHTKPLIFHARKHCCSIPTGRFGHNRTVFQHKCYQKGRQQGHNNYTHT